MEAFLSREAAEASSAESESDADAGLFDGDDACELAGTFDNIIAYSRVSG